MTTFRDLGLKEDICRALDLPDLSADPEYATFAKQMENKAELRAAKVFS